MERETWAEIQDDIAAAAVPVRQVPGEESQGTACLRALGVTTRSPLGAMAYHSGGLFVDHGWVRVYGGTTGALPSLTVVNAVPGPGFVVGHDVLGGVFAINGPDPGTRPGELGQMTYFAPDTLEWECLEVGYGAWLAWLLTAGLAQFYEGRRWPGWQADTETLDGGEGFSVVPFLWSKEAQDDIAATSRRAVPLAELLGIAAATAEQLGNPDPGVLGTV